VTGFADRLNEQLGDAFAASQQYLAMGVYYRVEMLPRLSAVCYDRALEQRDRALAMVRYLVDAGMPTIVPGIPAPETAFADVVAPLQSAVERERRMSDRAGELVRLARDSGDHGSEQFVKRLIGDQAHGLASLLSLLTVVRRCRHDPFRAEEFLAAGVVERGRFARADPAVEPVLAIA
jgi:ferritin